MKSKAPESGVGAGGQSAFRQRDVIVLLLMAFAIYLSIDSAGLDYSISPCWFYQDTSTSVGVSGDEILRNLQPIITDLDGDGTNEIVLVSADGSKIQVLNGEPPASTGYDEIYTPVVTYTAQLSTSKLNVRTGKAPVAIKTGYVDKYSETKGRQQVVVVLREDWTVVCFDAQLRLLWEKSVGHKVHQLDKDAGLLLSRYTIDDASITIAPLNFHAPDTGSNSASDAGGNTGVGVVVVGASMALREAYVTGGTKSSAHVHRGLESDLSKDTDTDKHHHGTDSHDGDDIGASLEHYSVYALSAVSGQILWAHDGSDSLARHSQNAHLRSLYTALPQHLFAMDKRDLSFRAAHEHGLCLYVRFQIYQQRQNANQWRRRLGLGSQLGGVQAVFNSRAAPCMAARARWLGNAFGALPKTSSCRPRQRGNQRVCSDIS